MSSLPFSLPFRQPPTSSSNQRVPKIISCGISCAVAERHEAPCCSIFRLTSHTISDVFMSDNVSPYVSPEQNDHEDNSSSSENRYLQGSADECSCATFDLVPHSASLDFTDPMVQDETLEPRMLFLDHQSTLWNMSSTPYAQQALDYSESGIKGECENALERSQPASEVSIPSPGDEIEDSADKPYARLIYEALMQAPGHRMMLREIYGWFAENTCKAQGSSSNGWQNSIRHNLSMNQAFENDKVGQVGGGHGRRANSVWFLTDDAIENGVQSTTRFRKSGPPKRCHNQRASQTQRQRSGARGGKVTKRVVSSRRNAPSSAQKHVTAPADMQPPQHDRGQTEATPRITGFGDTKGPLTPADDLLYEHVYELPPYDDSDGWPVIKEEMVPHDAKNILRDHPLETLYEDLAMLEQDPMLLGHVFV